MTSAVSHNVEQLIVSGRNKTGNRTPSRAFRSYASRANTCEEYDLSRPLAETTYQRRMRRPHSAHMRKSVGRSKTQHYQRTSPLLYNCVSPKGYRNGDGHHPTLCTRSMGDLSFPL
ncbi:hypothetical protein Bbelb_148190 [Branchiostoma belcheri]|nr:hypothetical protein Bbelb_148190 [Branchiostoma belcheri]